MRIHVLQPLFAWEALDDSPTLKTIRELLALLPDGKLLEGLRLAGPRTRRLSGVGVMGCGRAHAAVATHDIRGLPRRTVP